MAMALAASVSPSMAIMCRVGRGGPVLPWSSKAHTVIVSAEMAERLAVTSATTMPMASTCATVLLDSGEAGGEATLMFPNMSSAL